MFEDVLPDDTFKIPTRLDLQPTPVVLPISSCDGGRWL